MAKSITGWITIKGTHIPLLDGESKASAYNRFKKSFTLADKKVINEWVHKDKNISEKDGRLLSNIINQKGTVSGDVELYRNVTSPELGIKFREIKQNPDLLVGKEIEARSFLSTSKTLEGAQIFQGVTIKITNVSNTKGLDISKISDKKRETEVVFNKGTKYKITKCKLIRDKTGDVMNYDIEAKIIG